MSHLSRFAARLALGFVSIAIGARAQLTTVFEMNFNDSPATWEVYSAITINPDSHSSYYPNQSSDAAPLAGNPFSGFFAGDLGFWAVDDYTPGDLGSNYGLQLWVKNAGSVGGTTNIFSVGNPTADGINLSYGSGSYSGWLGNSDMVGSATVGSGSINGWDHLAIVTAAGTTTFYVNGITQGTFNTYAPTNPGIGWHGFLTPGGSALYSGLIDEIKVFTFAPGTFSSSQLDFASAIPEPSTYAAIIGAGALGLAAWRRRSRHALRMD